MKPHYVFGNLKMWRLQSFQFLLLTIFCFVSCYSVVVAQNQTRATTHPDDAGALNSIFAAWGTSATKEWNISGELCSGAAVDVLVTIESAANYPLIKCDCSFVNSTICRISALVESLDVKGPIPEELWTLNYLNYLSLTYSQLTGFLSPAIGNLNRLQFINLGINALSGTIPKQIGLLTDLTQIYLSSNNFYGSIPAEIGSCTKLQLVFFGTNTLSGRIPKQIGLLTELKELYLDKNNFSSSIPAEIGSCRKLEKMYIHSSGLSGRIPSSFANLVELKEFWIMDLELQGPIPDFIGSWTNLTILKIVGTGLSGPIPSSFSKLTSLTELRLSDISNGDTSLEFIKDMKSLNILVLRNNNLTGPLPSNFGEYSNLEQVDLSFNKLHGPIPNSLFNLGRLTYLFLGNNTLIGTLPTIKNASLQNIDVSYNDLSGSLPSWIRETNLQLNVVANNFTLEDLDNSFLPEIHCLQKNFACNVNQGNSFNFSINCGGPPINLFERDDRDLGPVWSFVSDDQTWAVSNVGLSDENRYITTSTLQITNTSESRIFESARLSKSSLRYYGLGLENGGYTITLHFAEIQIGEILKSWKGLGRRQFDIYVQGKLVEKNFDIRRTAGDSSFRSVKKEYKANVSKNYLEVHLFWAGKGTCCIPSEGTYGPLISAISAKSDSKPTVDNRPPSKENHKTDIIVGVIIGVVLLSLSAALVMFIIRKRRKQYKEDEEILNMDVRPYTFTYSELKSATQDFDPSNKLGEGGFGSVYKGNLNDGREVAVKQLSVGSRHGKEQFVAEIVAISSVLHRNLVKLYGCCFEGDHRLLVYEFLPNGSLDHALFGDKSLHLDWSTRYQICLGVARGLFYLHEEASVRIVHRDVKASNILLDAELVPKVSDFGLAKLYDDKKTHISTRVAGTIGYLAPEYAMRGHLTEKADVYAFGVVVLELVSGRKNSDQKLEMEKRYLLEWAWNLHEKDRDVELIDGELSEYNMEEVKCMIGIALLCTQTSHALRPSMSRVVAMLLGDAEVNDAISKPGYPIDYTIDDTTSSSSFSNFQTNGTSFSTSFVKPSTELVPGDLTGTKPMLGFNIKEGR